LFKVLVPDMLHCTTSLIRRSTAVFHKCDVYFYSLIKLQQYVICPGKTE